ncbi:MAG: sugar ABC transporter substrate-binding protein [Lachnospiraceae bacterium]|nr:sugar ABC transporter substrate-binding protein [Lachnospiraceae bacterium]
MKKKVLALLMAAAMVIGCAACGGGEGSSGDTAGNNTSKENIENSDQKKPAEGQEEEGGTQGAGVGEHFTIGYPTAPSYNAVMSAMHKNREAVAQAAGGELITEVFDFTPEGTVSAIEKLIQAGCNGVFVTPMADSILPTIVKMCEESNVYFVLSMRSVNDPEVKEIVEASPMYAGNVYENEVSAGYEMGKALADAGGKQYAIIAPAVGDTTGALREQGLAQAAEEFGLEQVAEVRAPEQASDSASAVESFIASYPELDGIIRLGSTATGDVGAICTTLNNLGKAGTIKFITVDTEEGCDAYLEDGTITATLNDLLVQDSIVAAAMLVNAITGTPLDGNEVAIEYSRIGKAEELSLYYEYIACDTPVFNTEEIRSTLLRAYNPEVTIDEISSMANTLTASGVKERREAQ